MKKTTQLVSTFILLILSATASAQNITNRGKDFWVGYGHHQFMEPTATPQNGQDMILYFSAEQAANVTVTVQGRTQTQITTYPVPANSVIASNVIPKSGPTDARLYDLPPSFGGNGGEGLFPVSIHIESDVPVVAYAHIFGSVSSGATMLLPTDAWGYTYTSINSQQIDAAGPAFSWVYVIAKDNNTVVRITPSVVTRLGKPAGTPFDVTLQKGQIYQIIGQSDGNGNGNQFTGTTVKSIANPSGQCYPVAVFSGSSRTRGESVPCGSGSGRDNDMQQAFPQHAWGKRYLTAPFSSASGPSTNVTLNASSFMTSVYKIVVKDPATIVTRNGLQLTPIITPGNYYQFSSNTADLIEADKPIMVGQFMSGSPLCNPGTWGDPEMVFLSPIEQSIKKVGFYRNTRQSIYANYVTLVIPTAGVSSLRIDGSNTFNYTGPHSVPGYSIVVKGWQAAQAQCQMSSDSAFTAITYGLGSAESYAYNAGTYLNNLSVKAEVFNIADTASKDSVRQFTCKGTPMRLSALVAYQPTKMVWRLSQLSAISPNADVVDNNPVPKDSVIIGVAKYYRYTLPATYVFSDTGTFELPIVNTHPSIDNCTNSEEVKVNIVVKPTPYTNLSFNHSGCLLDTAYFSSSVNGGNGHTVNKWQWNLGDGKTAMSKDTVNLYAAPGTYTVTLKVFSREGCVGDTVRTITIGNKPVASIVSTPPSACPGTPVVFTDTSATATAGTWYWNFGNSTSATLTSNAPQTVTYAAAGTYTVKHLYKSSATCISDTTIATIVINPNPAKPVATTPLSYCQNDAASPLTATALAGHTLTWYTAYPLTGGSATAPTPSTTAQGATQYYVTQTAPSGCVSDAAIITVNVTPALAGNTISASQTLCSGSPAAALTGTTPTGGAGAGSYTYQWQQSTDGGATWTNATGTGNTAATYNPGTLSSGTTKFRRVVSSGLCTNVSNVVDIVVQTNLASYNISASQTICEGSSPALLDGQTPTGGTGTYAFLWEMSTNGTTWTPASGNPTLEDYQPGPLTVKTYYRRTTTGGNCPAISNVVVITVNPTADGSIALVSGNICQTQSGSVSFTATAGTAPFTVNLLITPPGGSAAPYTVTQTVASNGPVNIPVVPVNSAGGAYTVTLISLSDAGNCTRTTGFSPVTINVTATPALSFTPAAPTVCAGASATLNVSGAASYAWSPAIGLSGATGATVTANPATTTTYTVTGTTNGCTGTGTVTVTVNPLPAKPVATPAAITYCQNTTATALSATVLAGHTLAWYSTYPLTGGSGTAPTPSTTTAGTFTYYVTQTNTATGCVSDPANIQVDVTPALAGNTVSATQTICAGTAAAALTGGAMNGGTNTYAYQWQQSTNGGTTWTNVSSGGTGVNYSPGVLLPGTTQFRRVVTSGLCSSTSNAVSITVQTSLSNYQISAAQTVCEGITPVLLDGQTPTGGTGSYTFIWESSPDGITWTVIPGATAEDYAPPALTTSTYYRRTSSGGICPATSNPVLITVNPAPDGTITGPAGICSYQTADVTFTASAGTAPFNVQLKITAPGGGTSTINQTVSSNGPVVINVLPLNSPAGTYTIALASITDSKGCSRTTGLTPVTVTVTAKPSVTVIAGAATICEGTSTTLTATGATSYAWTPVTGLSAATGASVTAAPVISTAYTVVGSTNGCTDTKTVAITVIARPAKPLVAAKVDYCMKAASVPLAATAAAGNTLTWYTSNLLTGGTPTAPVPSTAAAASYIYYVTQSNSNGCVSDTATVTVTVHPLPAVDFTLPGGICMPNGIASFANKTMVADNSILTYAWNFGDGSGTSAAANPSYTYAASGSYAVKLKAITPFGCADSNTKTLSSFFEKPIALFSVNPAELCQGQNNSFLDNSNPRGSTITKWWWDFGDGSTPGTTTNPTHRYTKPGTYTVKLVVTTAIGCLSDTLPVTVVVHLQPKIDAGPSFVVPQGTSVTFQASANDTTVTLFWSPPTGLSNPAKLRPTLTATQNQTYMLTAIGDFNCMATDTLTVRILKPLDIPNAFSPNGDGTNDTWLIPNLADYPDAKVEVFNRWGQQVFLSYGYNKPWDGTYLGKALPLATYYYIITLNNGFKPVAGSVTIIK